MEEILMAGKPTYEELEQKVSELEKEAIKLRQAEEAFREKQNQLDELLSNVDAIFLEGDPNKITYVGGQTDKILGYTNASINI